MKPKEYWIVEGETRMLALKADPRLIPTNHNAKVYAHVIEKSLFDKAMAALEFYANEEIYEQKEGASWETPDGQLQPGYFTQIFDHDNNGDKARNALIEIKTAISAGNDEK